MIRPRFRLHWLWASIAVIVAVLVIAWIYRDGLGNLFRSRSNLAHEEVRLKSKEANAKRCIAELASRDPLFDAQQDFARGDTTPIGLTYWPHDPPDPTTHYERACEHEYDGEYRQTGKWFPYSRDGFSHLPRPASYGICQRNARAYASRYNQSMVELAPQAIRQFCLSQRLADSSRLGAASFAILGTAREKREIIDGIAYQTKASWVVDTRYGPVLVTKSYFPDADPYCGDCHVGGVGVAYLKEKGAQISAERRWPLIWSGDSNLNRNDIVSGGLSLNDQLTGYPVLGVDGRRPRRLPQSRQHCGWERTLIELRPEGPVNRGTIYSHPQERYENVVRDQSFDIVMPGTDTRDHYRMEGKQFVGPEEGQLKC